MEYIADSVVTGLRSFTQQAIVKLPSRKFVAGVVAYAPAPLRYKYVLPVSFRYFAPFSKLFENNNNNNNNNNNLNSNHDNRT